eukprot:7166928-Prymnesium_polylepis.1
MPKYRVWRHGELAEEVRATVDEHISHTPPPQRPIHCSALHPRSRGAGGRHHGAVGRSDGRLPPRLLLFLGGAPAAGGAAAAADRNGRQRAHVQHERAQRGRRSLRGQPCRLDAALRAGANCGRRRAHELLPGRARRARALGRPGGARPRRGAAGRAVLRRRGRGAAGRGARLLGVRRHAAGCAAGGAAAARDHARAGAHVHLRPAGRRAQGRARRGRGVTLLQNPALRTSVRRVVMYVVAVGK